MGKQGPCYHCGVTSTPLWRNGPPEKPVLCNACGSRWRTKGTLANYTPLHARAETDDYEDQRVSRVKSISLNKKKEVALLKRKKNQDNVVSGGFAPDYNQGYHKVVDEDISNRSSSGSAISNSESCAPYGHGGMDASDLTGPAQSVVWDALVPSKKRTCVGRPKPSSVEKLTKDLCTILHEQQSYFSASSEDLLFASDTPMVSVEIGHGSILIRHPSYIAREEESEASSLSVDNKQCPLSEAYSYSGAILMHNDSSRLKSSSLEVEKISTGQGMQQEQLKSDKSQLERVQILGNHESPSCSIDLNKCKNKAGKSDTVGFTGTATTDVVNSKASANVGNIKRICDSRNQNFPELKTIVRSPKRMITKAGYEAKEGVEDGACYSPKNLFALPPDASSLLLDSLNFIEDSSDQDLLLEVPSNTSFQQAELLHPTLSLGAQASNSSSSVYSHHVHH